ncbi:MurR/RpiR family transcriptional regulator [Paenibacillus sp. JX-17]|uniref:MurR/RpiR family transcriptional regulator n=1 Tax=Paenibacillus lacisoli TaxID=3064525 RepID=A0ABT9CCJ7_9BACL|nr:MurR/RpiR family transcriptional regulator [Paenibacillus sp. JX-17]MDO7906952.1 MurR/RpiR family transcriptional regulator [Paenibacillus sp. JX-17]
MSTILQNISRQLDRLSIQEQKLARTILNAPAEVTRLGIRELAESCGISPATVTRFSKSLHFKGYPDFKISLAAELAQPAGTATYQDIVAGNSLSDIASAIEANHLASITDTTRLLDMEKLQRAVQILCDSRRIDLYGMATSSIVAQDFSQKLVRIGKYSLAQSDPHMQITSASALGSGDVAMAISYSGETPETIEALTYAKRNGAFTLSLTSYGSNPLAGLADIALFSSSLEEGMRRGDMASRIAQLHVIDILFTSMVSARFDEYTPKLEQSYQHVQSMNKRQRGR